MAKAVEKQVAVEAKAAHDANGGDKVSEAALENSPKPVEKINVRKQTAESIGVSENIYRDMKLVAEAFLSESWW